MIIFYDDLGNIKGTIDGRIHGDEHKNMAQSDESGKELNKLVVEWIPIAFFDKEDNLLDTQKVVEGDKEENKKSFVAMFEPDHPQRELFELIEQKVSLLYNYKIDPKTKLLTEKTPEELKPKTPEERDPVQHEKRENLRQIVVNEALPLEERFNALVEVFGLKRKSLDVAPKKKLV